MTLESFPSNQLSDTPENPILEHGLELITRDGIRGFTVESLARDLAMSKKTVYKYFPTKEILLNQIFKYITRIIEGKFQDIHNMDINPLDKFEAAIAEIIKMINRVSVHKIGELKARYPLIWKDIEKFRLARRDDFLTIFKQARVEGYVRSEIDLELTATIYMRIMNEVFQPEFFMAQDISVKETMLTFRGIFLRGICTEKGLLHLKDKL